MNGNINTEGYLELRKWAEVFADLQSQRIRLFNTLGLKADGTPTKPRPNAINVDPSKYETLIELTIANEDQARKLLVEQYRTIVPPEIQQWQERNAGIGEHSLAKLLGYVGHPRIAFPMIWVYDTKGKRLPELQRLPSFDRTVSQLWQYAGVGAPARRERGMDKDDAMALGNPNAKKALWMIAQGIIKNGDYYREVYDKAREKYAEATHTLECVRCTPKGKPPAAIGTPMKLGHKHGIATRAVMKEVLRDLWLVTPV